MTDEDDPKLVEVMLAPPRPYRWASKLLLIIAALLLALAVAFLAPTSWRLSNTVHDLARSNAVEKAQDACYDQYTSDVTDGNARTQAANVDSNAALGDSNAALGALIVALARGQRDPVTVDPLIDRIDQTSQRAAEASQRASQAVRDYNAAIAARNDYVAAGRPLPCTNLPN